MKLTNTYRIRLSDADLHLLNELKKHRIKPTTFIRDAFREKIKSELPKIKERKQYCPF